MSLSPDVLLKVKDSRHRDTPVCIILILISISFCQAWHVSGFLFTFLDDFMSFHTRNLRNVREGEAGRLRKLAVMESENLKVRRGCTGSLDQSCSKIWISVYNILTGSRPDSVRTFPVSLFEHSWLLGFDRKPSSWSLHLRTQSTPLGTLRTTEFLVPMTVLPIWFAMVFLFLH